MRVGQKNGLVYQWAQKGTRPRQPKDQRYANAYVFGAICPARDTGTALVLWRLDVRRTIARELAEAAAAAALPEQFQGNALALLQAVYRNTANELRVRIDAAGKALPFEMARPERIRAYERARAIQGNDGKVVDINRVPTTGSPQADASDQADITVEGGCGPRPCIAWTFVGRRIGAA
jgi:hypothetical protein